MSRKSNIIQIALQSLLFAIGAGVLIALHAFVALVWLAIAVYFYACFAWAERISRERGELLAAVYPHLVAYKEMVDANATAPAGTQTCSHGAVMQPEATCSTKVA